MAMGVLDQILLGLSTAASLQNLAFCFAGVVLGTVVGIIPGIGALATISLLFPLTLYLDTTAALIMLAGIFYGGTYGGSTASILLNLPGTPANAVTALDGYPMARNGRAGVALLTTTVASFFGAVIGIAALLAFSPAIAALALQFGPAEYFGLIVLGLVASIAISTGSFLHGAAMIVLGILLGVVGIDIFTGQQRFTFGWLELAEGLSIIAMAMGIFGVSEVIASVHLRGEKTDPGDLSLRAMLPTAAESRSTVWPMLRGSGIGAFFGALPGTGGTVASFVSYAAEKKLAAEPRRFGRGAIEGIAGPESANNAADQTAFIPTLTLGVPGTATMALILGAMMIHGVQPGPRLITDSPGLFWGLIMSFLIGNFLLLVLNSVLIGLFVRILLIPYSMLFPAVLAFVCIGVLSIRNSPFDVLLVVLFAAMGTAMRLLGFPAAPLLLGFVLGPMLEENFRRAMSLSRGDPSYLFGSTISAALLALTALLVLANLYGWLRMRGRPPVDARKSSDTGEASQ